jgi:hypothetical protein
VIEKKPLWLIVWGDAWGSSGWKDIDDAVGMHGAMEVTSIGFVIKADKKGILFAQGYSEQNTPLGVSFVPRGMIKKIRKIKY